MNLLGKGHDPLFWSKEVATKECYKKYLEERKGLWDKECADNVIYELKYTNFKLFTVTGDRATYENQYFRRRRQLGTSAILSLVYPEEEKYINFLHDIIFAICNEYTWCIPAHNTPLEVNNRVHLDLFSSETGFSLAQIYTLLGDRLEPLIRERIKREVNVRIFDSFMSDTKYWWANGKNNWTAVCCGSIAGTAMLLRPDLFETLKPRIDSAMESYLSGFNNDGFCLEGTHYWHYGFGFFLKYADMVKTFTNGEVDYFTREKVRNIATFIQKVYLSGMASVSFADSPLINKYHIGMVHYLKKIYPDDIKVYSPEYAYFDDGCCRFPLLTGAAIWVDEDIYNNPEPDDADAEYYASDSKWYIKRNAAYGFAAKAGHNNEHHNHNDVGTFIFAKNGEQLITDPGKGVYCKQYFRPETRYTDFIECSSLGHCVPYFSDNGVQLYGRQYAATDVEFVPGKFSMDIAGAYGSDDVKSVKRTFTFSDDSVVLSDVFDYTGAGKITERIVSVSAPVIEEGKITIEDCMLTFDNSICTVSVDSVITSTKKELYLIDFTLNDGVDSFEVEIK